LGPLWWRHCAPRPAAWCSSTRTALLPQRLHSERPEACGWRPMATALRAASPPIRSVAVLTSGKASFRPAACQGESDSSYTIATRRPPPSWPSPWQWVHVSRWWGPPHAASGLGRSGATAGPKRTARLRAVDRCTRSTTMPASSANSSPTTARHAREGSRALLGPLLIDASGQERVDSAAARPAQGQTWRGERDIHAVPCEALRALGRGASVLPSTRAAPPRLVRCGRVETSTKLQLSRWARHCLSLRCDRHYPLRPAPPAPPTAVSSLRARCAGRGTRAAARAGNPSALRSPSSRPHSGRR
jgi:hypothetical protein